MSGGIPMDPICPRCKGKHGIEVSGDGYEWDCRACGGHLMCAIGMEGEMYPWHRADGTCGCVGEPHTCEMDESERAEMLAEAAEDQDEDQDEDGENAWRDQNDRRYEPAIASGQCIGDMCLNADPDHLPEECFDAELAEEQFGPPESVTGPNGCTCGNNGDCNCPFEVSP